MKPNQHGKFDEAKSHVTTLSLGWRRKLIAQTHAIVSPSLLHDKVLVLLGRAHIIYIVSTTGVPAPTKK